jgi:hypothetical protein
MCKDCNDYHFKKIQHKKEHAVGEFLFQNDYKPYLKDQIIDSSCSKKRPDFVFDFTSLYVIVEVDENAHKSYACECEQGRMIQIHQDCGGMPILFIRFNPDDYIDNAGKKNSVILSKRYLQLLNLMNKIWNLTIQKDEVWNIPLSVCYLFYDGYNNVPEFYSLEYMNNSVKQINIDIYK